MVFIRVVFYLFFSFSLVLLIRFLCKTSLVYILFKSWNSMVDRFHVYRYYRVPLFNDNFQENQLYRQISVYLNSLPSLEDSDFTNLLSGTKPGDIFLQLSPGETVHDSFLEAKMAWTNENSSEEDGSHSFVLKMRKNDKRRVFRQYLQHILSIADEIGQRKKEIRLHMNMGAEIGKVRWTTVPFTHPAGFDTVVMDGDLKNKVRSDLEQFLRSKQYYNRLGRVWKRSYLLCGPAGTGKTSLIAAMARFLCYDIYAIDLSKISDDSRMKRLLLQTTPKSLIVVEDLDRFLMGKWTGASLSGVLNFIDGLVSCCGEERLMVFTMNDKAHVDQAVLRPGRIDFHVELPMCDFPLFKSLAAAYLGVKEHKLFPQAEEIFQAGASLSPAEIGEIMISNRGSPSRALKSVISALQTDADERAEKKASSRLSEESRLGRSESKRSMFGRENIQAVKEFQKLYGLLRIGSRRKEEAPDSNSNSADKEGSRQDERRSFFSQ